MAPTCQEGLRSTLRQGVVALFLLSECDRWSVLHIVTPFLLTVYTRSGFFGFFMAGIGEFLEYFGLTLWGTFAIFVTNTNTKVDPNTDVESLANIFVADWLLQGGIGVLLGWVFYQMVECPALYKWEDIWKRPYTFCYYTFWLLGTIVLKGAFYSMEFGSFKFGIHFYYMADIVLILVLELTQPKHTWQGYTKRQKGIYYFWWLFIVIVLNVQNQFDYLYSSYVQSWLWSSILLFVFMLPYSAWKWKWHRNIEFDFNLLW